MEPAARITDQHICPLSDGPKPHVGGPITTGEPTVQIGGLAAARVGDAATCAGPPDAIATGCPTVWIKGKPAARVKDKTVHGGNIITGCIGVFIGDPATDSALGGLLAILCPEAQPAFDGLRRDGWTVVTFDSGQWPDEEFDGTRWKVKPMDFGGETSQGLKTMKLNLSQNREENAATVFHEATHTLQPAGMSWPEKEYDAHKKEEEFRIKKGLPDHSPPGYHFRTTDAAGNTVVNEAEIRRYVNVVYPFAPPPGGPTTTPDVVIGKLPGGKVTVQRSDGSTYERPAKKGDRIPHVLVTVPATGTPIDVNKLRCP